MPTVDELKQAFEVYLNEIDLCRVQRCHFAMLHILVCIPDICGTLAHPKANGGTDDYKRWCDDYLKSLPLNGAERWELRNKLLHRGWSTPGPDKVGRYSGYLYGEPRTPTHLVLHDVLVIDVEELREETIQGLKSWCEDVAAGKATGHENVAANLGSIVRADTYSIVTPAADGTDLTAMYSVTSGWDPSSNSLSGVSGPSGLLIYPTKKP